MNSTDNGRLTMRHKAIIAALVLVASNVFAGQECTTQTFITEGGIIKTCSTCCSSGQCTTLCF